MAGSSSESVPMAGPQLPFRHLFPFYHFEVTVEPRRLLVRNLAPKLYPGIPTEFVHSDDTVKLVASASDLIFFCAVLVVGDRSRAEHCGLAVPVWRVRKLKRELWRNGYDVRWSFALTARLTLED